VYICICNAITDHEVRGAVALGARSLSDLKATLGVATQCGRCADCAHGLVREACANLAECAAGDD
jgi:bacterioferritin-associated ferredoxin